ncbi:MAG: phosphatase PAP2 family protein [Bacteriovoracia bacterium]
MSLFSGQVVWVPFIGFFFWHCYKTKGRSSTLYFGLFLLLAIVASDVTSSYILKNIVNRLRPCREVDLKPLIYSFGQKCGGKYGFVSSHAANSIALLFFSLKTLHLGKWSWALWLIPFIVSFSRIYLGVHYPGDILGGAVVGILWGYTFSYFYNSYQGARR